MINVNPELQPRKLKRSAIIAGILLLSSFFCIAMTVVFVYVSHEANQKVATIRQYYAGLAEKRDEQVSQLAFEVIQLQKKLDALPEDTADKMKSAVAAQEQNNP